MSERPTPCAQATLRRCRFCGTESTPDTYQSVTGWHCTCTFCGAHSFQPHGEAQEASVVRVFEPVLDPDREPTGGLIPWAIFGVMAALFAIALMVAS